VKVLKAVPNKPVEAGFYKITVEFDHREAEKDGFVTRVYVVDDWGVDYETDMLYLEQKGSSTTFHIPLSNILTITAKDLREGVGQ
jgi:hypothetical protein